MKRFSGFKETINHISPPAIRRSIGSEYRQKLIQIVKYVQNGLLKLIDYGSYIKENYSDDSHRYEPKLFPNNCAYVCDFLKRNSIQPVLGVPNHTCGTEGCAYFYNDKVLKCTLGKDEWQIAGMLKGDRSLAPVIDTDREPETKVYLILSWKLNTDEAKRRSEEIRSSANLVIEWFEDRKIKEIEPHDKETINLLLDVDHFKRFVHNTLPELPSWRKTGFQLETAVRLFELVVQLYHKTNYLLAADLGYKNVGFTDRGDLQVLDFGYPRKLGTGYVGFGSGTPSSSPQWKPDSNAPWDDNDS